MSWGGGRGGSNTTFSFNRGLAKNWRAPHSGVWGVVPDIDDFATEADDGADLVEFIRTCRHFGRDAFLETDVDFYG